MLHNIVQLFVDWVIHHGGLYMILFILFAESGLFLGFFLPGDSLLFAAGIYLDDLAQTFFNAPFYMILLVMALSTTLGSFVGYYIGEKAGNYLLRKKDSFLFRRKYLDQARGFYNRHGKVTIFLSKFLPVLRTFAPLVGGMVKMPFRVFSFYTITGSFSWVLILGVAGYYLQTLLEQRYHFSLKDHIGYISLIIIIITTLPVLFKIWIGRGKPARQLK